MTTQEPGVRFNRLRAMVRALPGAMVRALPTVYTDTGAEGGVPPPKLCPKVLLNLAPGLPPAARSEIKGARGDP